MEYKSTLLKDLKFEDEEGNQAVYDFVEPECTIVCNGIEVSAQGCSVINGQWVDGYLNKTGDKLTSWDGKEIISDDVRLLISYDHPYQDFSIYMVYYKGAWYIGWASIQFFSGKPAKPSFEEYFDGVSEYNKFMVGEYIRHMKREYENYDITDIIDEEYLNDYFGEESDDDS